MLSPMIYQRVIKIVQPRNLATMDNRRRKQDEGQYNSQWDQKFCKVAYEIIKINTYMIKCFYKLVTPTLLARNSKARLKVARAWPGTPLKLK